MNPRALLPALALSIALPGSALAHPHVFIDANFELVFNEAGELAAVQIDWAYDDFYSLMLVEENGLDADGDGTPEQAALDAFAGQDVDWAAGFPGDFVIENGGAAVALDGPVEHRVRFEGGRVVTSHVRPVSVPFDVSGQAITARAYDPTYFVAYDVPGDPSMIGREGCVLSRNVADRDKAQEEYGERLAEIDEFSDPFEEIELPDIGVLFADSFVLTCASSS